MRVFILAFLFIIFPAGLSCWSSEQEKFIEVSFETVDGGKIFANIYGKGDHSILLAHGAVFNKESWHQLAVTISEKGYRVMAIDFRGYGRSVPGSEGKKLQLDVLGAIDYLNKTGAKIISAVGGSMGGGAVAQAATELEHTIPYRLILLSPVPIKDPERIRAGKVVFVASRDEELFPKIEDQYRRAPEPKTFNVLPGNAHAQNIFKTDQAQHLTDIIVSCLAER